MKTCNKHLKQNNNSTNLRQVDGGVVIKQGDTSSYFEYELLDENQEPIVLDGQEAIVRLVKSSLETSKIVYEKPVIVTGNTVRFNFEDIVPEGCFYVEIWCAGYVFPSGKSPKLKITSSAMEYELENEVEKLLAARIAELEEQVKTKTGIGYKHVQSVTESIWNVTHNLGYLPVVDVIDSGNNVVYGEITHLNENALQIKFSAPFKGTAILK